MRQRFLNILASLFRVHIFEETALIHFKREQFRHGWEVGMIEGDRRNRDVFCMTCERNFKTCVYDPKMICVGHKANLKTCKEFDSFFSKQLRERHIRMMRGDKLEDIITEVPLY